MKTLLSILFITAASLSYGQVKPAMGEQLAPGAKLVFDSTTIEYGTIAFDSDGNRTFTFTNAGDEPLIITNCQQSCGCTTPHCPKEPIMPGEKGSIVVHYDTKRVGAFTKTVTINSNGSESPVVLKIKGTVLAAKN